MSWIEQFERLLSKERRRGWRKPVRVPVQVVLKDDTAFGCELTEASPSGFRVRSPRKMPTNQLLQLRFPGRRYKGELLEVPAEFVWNRSVQVVGGLPYRCGGRFMPMTDRLRERLAERLLITSGLELVQSIEKRKNTRLMQHATIGKEKLVVRDISLEGVGLLAQRAPAMGERVEVVVNPSEPIRCEGQVIWSRPALGGHAHYVGVRFENLSEATREALVAHLSEMIQKDGLFRY